MNISRQSILRIALCLLLLSGSYGQMSLASESAEDLDRQYITGLPLLADEIARLQPGLLPNYFYNFFARDVRMLPQSGGETGEPIIEINHNFDRGVVFGSGTNRGIGVRMTGALHLPATGTYIFQTLSNGGLEIYLGDNRILSDPIQHSDRLSPKSAVSVSVAGWYPIKIKYFQRKGAAALKFYWQPPGSEEQVIVPSEVLGHFPKENL